MAQSVPCPRCRRTLRVSDDFDGRWLTCPRCLAEVEAPASEEERERRRQRRLLSGRADAVDQNARRNLGLTGLGLVIVALLGGCALFLALPAAGGAGSPGDAMLISGLLVLGNTALLGVSIVGLVLSARSGSLGLSLSGSLVGGGALFVLSGAALISVIIFLVSTCVAVVKAS